MHAPPGQPYGRRPSRVPLAVATACALVLGALALPAASGLLDAGDAQANTSGPVLRIALAFAGGCCLTGAVLLVLLRPAGRIVAGVGGSVVLAFPVLMFPAFVAAPVDLALGIRESGGLLVLAALILLGLPTTVLSLGRGTRDAIARHHARV